MLAISWYIFAVCMCHIKILSNFCFPISCLSVPKKSLYCNHFPPCYPWSGHIGWPCHSWYTLLVEFMGSKFDIYLRVGPVGILKLLWYILCIRNQQNALNSTGVFLLWYIHLHVSASNLAIFRVTFLLQDYSLIEFVKLLHRVEIHTIIG